MSSLDYVQGATITGARIRIGLRSYGEAIERSIAGVLLLVALVFTAIRPEALAARQPLLLLAIAFFALFVVPGSVVLSWWTPDEQEGFCGAIVRSFLISFLLIAAGTIVGLQFGLPAVAFAVLLLVCTLAAAAAATVRGRPAYFARAVRFSWKAQRPAERIVSLVVVAGAVGMATLLFVNGYPTGISAEEIIPARKIAEVTPLAADLIMQRPGVPPTYLYPALTFGMALLSRASALDVLVVATNLTGPLLLLALAALVAFTSAFFRDIRVAWVSVVVILSIIVVDPAALTHDLGMFIPIPNRYGFAPAILLPACFYVLWRGVAGADRGALVLVPLGVLATALVHARDAAHILILVAATGFALLLGDVHDRKRLPRLGMVLGASIVLLVAYQVLQSIAVEHAAVVTRGLRSVLLDYLQSLVHEPATAIWGTVPKTVVSPVGDWRYQNYILMIQIFLVVTRTWLPLGLIAAGAFLGRWAPWPLRACAWTIAGALLMVRIPFVYTLVSAIAGDPDVGQLSAPLALLSLPLVAAGAMVILDASQEVVRRTVRQTIAASLVVLALFTALSMAWIEFPVAQAAWRRFHLLQQAQPDLLILSAMVVALLASLVFLASGWRSRSNRPLRIAGCLATGLAIIPIGAAWLQATSAAADDPSAVWWACGCLLACLVTGALLIRPHSLVWAPSPAYRRSGVAMVALVPVLIAASVTLTRMLQPSGPDAPRYQSLELQLWGPNRAGNIRADPASFYEDLVAGRNVNFSREVLDYLRDSLPPLSMVYAPRNVLTGIAVTSNQYVVYYGDVKISTDIDYYSRYSRDDHDLLFNVPPSESGREALLRLFDDYKVTHVLATPEVSDEVQAWLPLVNEFGTVLERIFNNNGYIVYQVHAEGVASTGGNP